MPYNVPNGQNPNNKKPNKYGGDIVNELIRFPEVLVIGPDGQQLGKMSRNKALETAYEYSLDIICVAPNANPPVCKILDYGKYRFQAQKKAKEAKKKQHIIEIKEVQLTPQIGENDLKIKAKKATEFLQDGNKVKVVVRYRGRQLAHQEVGVEVLNKFISYVDEFAVVEKPSVLEGKFLTTVLGPKKK